MAFFWLSQERLDWEGYLKTLGPALDKAEMEFGFFLMPSFPRCWLGDEKFDMVSLVVHSTQIRSSIKKIGTTWITHQEITKTAGSRWIYLDQLSLRLVFSGFPDQTRGYQGTMHSTE